MAITAIITTEDAAKAATPLVAPLVQQAQRLTVTSNEDYEMACTFLQLVATRKKQVDEVFDPIVKAAHEAHKQAVSKKKMFMDPLLTAEFEVKGKVSKFAAEEERKRREEEQRLAEEQRKTAEANALEEVKRLEAAGERELAEIVLQNAAEEPAPVVVLPSSVPRQSGIAARKTYKFRVVNEALIPREYLKVNEVAIGAVVRAQKNLTKIPGIEVYAEDSVSVRV